MSVVKSNSKFAVKEESTEGTYVAPASGADFIQPLEDGLELQPSRELVERNVMNSSVGKSKPRLGTGSVSGSVEMELKAGSAEGLAPEAELLLKSGLGVKRSLASAVTTAESHTTTVLYIENADIASFNVGDIILVKQSGAYHVSPITAVDSTVDAANITMLVAMGTAPSDNVEIAKFTTFTTGNAQTNALSMTMYQEDAIKTTAMGCRVGSIALANFTTGALPTLSFGFEGLDYDKSVEAPAYTPALDSNLPPIALEAKVFMDGTAIEINELALQIDNTLGWRTSVSSKRGRSSSRITERSVTGSIDPYKASDSVANYTNFENGTSFSLFAYAFNPTSTAGQFNEIVAVYLPDCMSTEVSDSDSDGLMKDSISFSATRGANGDSEELFLSFI